MQAEGQQAGGYSGIHNGQVMAVDLDAVLRVVPSAAIQCGLAAASRLDRWLPLLLQQRQHAFHRRLGFGAGVVVAAQLPQGGIELGGQQQDEEGAAVGHRHLSSGPGQHAEQAHAQIQRQHRNGNRGEQFQYRGGQEGQAQHPHGAAAVILGGLLHRQLGGGQGLQVAQGTQAAQQIEKAPTHPPQCAELALTGSGGAPPQQHHEQRHQRSSGQQQNSRQQAVPGGRQHQQQRHQQHQLALHLIAADVAIQRVHLLQQLTGQLGIRAQGAASRAQRCQTLQQQLTQITSRPPTGPLAQPFPEKLQQRAQQQAQQQRRPPPPGHDANIAPAAMPHLQPVAEQTGDDPALQDEQHRRAQRQSQRHTEQTPLPLYQPLQPAPGLLG